MPAELTDLQRSTLAVLCDTIVPRIDREDDPHGFWARSASDLGIAPAVEQIIAGLPELARAGLGQLLDALALQGIEGMPSQASREQIVRNTALASPDAAGGLGALIGITLFLTYGAPDPVTFRNPAWDVFGYPGPISPPPTQARELNVLVPEGDPAELEADVCVVGSGAGGGVIAGTLAAQGLRVLVLEAGGYYDESDFAQLELKAYQEMYWRGGPAPTADGNVSLQAGATLGGGTTINWTNCLRTTPWVREQWAQEFGLEGVDGADFDRHLDTVLARIGANDKCSDLNGPQQRMREASERLCWSFKNVVRNADPDRYTPESAGYMGFGDQSGSKQNTVKTFLRDAADHDAEIVVRCRAQRILVENGRAAGVEAFYTDDSGRVVPVHVRAPRVVVAAGALESPALLLRSGIGGPAAGDYLRLHPCVTVFGSYLEDQKAWWGAPHTGLIDEFATPARDTAFSSKVRSTRRRSLARPCRGPRARSTRKSWPTCARASASSRSRATTATAA